MLNLINYQEIISNNSYPTINNNSQWVLFVILCQYISYEIRQKKTYR